MKDNRNPVIGIALLIIGVIGLSALSGMRLSPGGMMDRAGMKEMMKNMMGTQLPPGLILSTYPIRDQAARNCLPDIVSSAMSCPVQACTRRTSGRP